MMRVRTVRFTIIAAIGVALTVAIALYVLDGRAFRDSSSTLDLAHAGFHMMGLEGFVVQEQFGSNTSERGELSAFAKKEGELLRITILSGMGRDEARRYRTGQFLLLEGQFDTELPPYPEFLTNQTGCAQKFLPVRKTKEEGDYFLIHAGERFDYGLCADDLTHYKAGFGIFYCEAERKVFQVEYFLEKEKTFSAVDEFMDSFSCRST